MGYVEFEGMDLEYAVELQEWVNRSVKASGIGQETFEQLVAGYDEACEKHVGCRYLDSLGEISYVGINEVIKDASEEGASLVDSVLAADPIEMVEEATEELSLPAVVEDSVPGDYTWVLKALGGAALIGGAVYGIKKLWDRHQNKKKVIVSDVDIIPGGIILASGYYKGHVWAIGGSFVDNHIKFGSVRTDYDYSNDKSYVYEIEHAVRERLKK